MPKHVPLLTLLLLWGSSCVGPAWAGELEAGVAVADITPPVGYRLRGYFHERLSTGQHDPLRAKALVLRQGQERVAVVLCDLCTISREVTDRARESASRATGIPAENIVVAATHTHTGPDYDGVGRLVQHERAVAAHGRDPHEQVDYPDLLARRIAEAIIEANSAAAPVGLSAGIAHQEGLSFNRRFHMKDGVVRTNPGKRNPDVIRAVGPIDPEVGILLLRAPGGSGDERAIAALTVFALHLDTVGGTEFSADYPFHLEQALRRDLGDGFISLFGTGTCGDINHIDVFSEAVQHSGHEQAGRIGETLAGTVKAELPNLAPLDRPSLAMRSATITVPAQRYGPERVEWARQFIADPPAGSFLPLVEAYKILGLELRGRPESLEMEVQAMRLNDETAIVFLPGEVFVELGLAIKKASPFKRTFIIELANDAPAYIPTRRAFAEGGYETTNSYIQPGGGESLAEAAIELLKFLRGQ